MTVLANYLSQLEGQAPDAGAAAYYAALDAVAAGLIVETWLAQWQVSQDAT